MYDELERAYGGRTRRGPSVVGWILIALAAFFVVGVAGVALAFHMVRTEVREFAERLEAAPAERVSAQMSDILAHLGSGALSADPTLGRAILSNLQAGGMEQDELRDLIEGSLRIRTGEGELRADLRGGEDGGYLVVRSPDGEVRFGAGEAAEGAPGWVPRPAGMPAETRQVFSAASDEGFLGVTTWETEAPPRALAEAYRERLREGGFNLRSEHSLRAGESRNASVVGRDNGSERTVFLAASVEGGVTKVVLGWAEGVER